MTIEVPIWIVTGGAIWLLLSFPAICWAVSETFRKESTDEV